MIRIQLHITEAQNRSLRALARERGGTRADQIRRAIDLMLAQGVGKQDALLELVGALGPAQRADLSERHDELLYSTEPNPLPRGAERPNKP
jgi:hypothetical protein